MGNDLPWLRRPSLSDSFFWPIYKFVITSFGFEVMFLVVLVSLSVCLFVCLWFKHVLLISKQVKNLYKWTSVCLSVDNITQKVMNGLG